MPPTAATNDAHNPASTASKNGDKPGVQDDQTKVENENSVEKHDGLIPGDQAKEDQAESPIVINDEETVKKDEGSTAKKAFSGGSQEQNTTADTPIKIDNESPSVQPEIGTEEAGQKAGQTEDLTVENDETQRRVRDEKLTDASAKDPIEIKDEDVKENGVQNGEQKQGQAVVQVEDLTGGQDEIQKERPAEHLAAADQVKSKNEMDLDAEVDTSTQNATSSAPKSEDKAEMHPPHSPLKRALNDEQNNDEQSASSPIKKQRINIPRPLSTTTNSIAHLSTAKQAKNEETISALKDVTSYMDQGLRGCSATVSEMRNAMASMEEAILGFQSCMNNAFLGLQKLQNTIKDVRAEKPVDEARELVRGLLAEELKDQVEVEEVLKGVGL